MGDVRKHRGRRNGQMHRELEQLELPKNRGDRSKKCWYQLCRDRGGTDALVPSDEVLVVSAKSRLMEMDIPDDLVRSKTVPHAVWPVESDVTKTQLDYSLFLRGQGLEIQNGETLVQKPLTTLDEQVVPP